MSIDMYLGSSDQQASSVGKVLQQRITAYKSLQRALEQLVSSSPDLSGHTYASAKRYSEQVLIPLMRGCILLDEAIKEACAAFPNDYRRQVDSVDLKESELVDQISRSDRIIGRYVELIDLEYRQELPNYSYIANLKSGESNQRQVKRKLEEKLLKLREFDSNSRHLFSSIAALAEAVNTGIRQTKTSWNGTSQTFTLPRALDLEWTKVVEKRWEKSKHNLQLEYDHIVNKLKEGGELNDNDLTIIGYYIKKFPTNDLSQIISNSILANNIGVINSFSKAASYTSTGWLVLAEGFASIDKIKGGTWWRKPVSRIYSRTGYKTWKQVSGDVSRFKKVKIAKNTDELINGTGKIVKGSGAKGILKSIGILGGSMAVLDGATIYYDRVDEYGATSAVIDGVAHTGTAVGAIYVGAAIGSLIPIPVVGTVIGAATGAIVNNLANIIYDEFAHSTQ
ncbi:T7SS effector LXG polymorphic toxin [Streptococcus equi]|uniref:T7SS effector LXG polymorphic toxin n=1 Tax=Streptococcus equi TaxID=1336 RepID=UPI001BB59903|nr:T7SS effector LXG polymorphic toxin [Streptococcus equi]QTZ59050.1 hypothetical protein MCPGFBBE_01155 [Streptococcus equi subsp. zooepidemicus]